MRCGEHLVFREKPAPFAGVCQCCIDDVGEVLRVEHAGKQAAQRRPRQTTDWEPDKAGSPKRAKSLTLTVAEAAAEMHIATSTLYAMVKRGEVPNVGIGRVLIPRIWVERRRA